MHLNKHPGILEWFTAQQTTMTHLLIDCLAKKYLYMHMYICFFVCFVSAEVSHTCSEDSCSLPDIIGIDYLSAVGI